MSKLNQEIEAGRSRLLLITKGYLGGLGGLFPLSPPDGLPVVLGPLGGLVAAFAMIINFHTKLSKTSAGDK
jgi:hypothetical protein